jgi:protoheme IX farnesyltransferase
MSTGAASKSLAADLLELAKPRITLLVTLTTAAGFAVAAPFGELDWTLFANTVVGTALVCAGSAVLNQYAERELDRACAGRAAAAAPAARRRRWLRPGVLRRRRHRRLSLRQRAHGLLAIATWPPTSSSLYAAQDRAFSPPSSARSRAPRRRCWAGPAPRTLELGGWLLFAILFLWQLPHFLSIAWLYRDDYRRAGMHLLTIDDPDFGRTVRQTVVWAVALLPVSLMPSAVGLGGRLYLVGAASAGALFLAAAFAFAREPRVESARRLLLVSVFYLRSSSASRSRSPADRTLKPGSAVKRTLLALAPATAVLVHCSGARLAVRRRADRDAADFALTERDGSKVTRADLAGAPWVADFVFTRCVSTARDSPPG